MYVYPSFQTNGTSFKNSNYTSVLRLSAKALVNVKMFEIANQSIEGGI